MGNTGTMDILAVASAQEADATQEADAAPGAEGVGVTEGRWLCWQSTQRTQAGDRLLCQAQSDLGGGSLLKTPGTLKQSRFPHPLLLTGRARRPLAPSCVPGEMKLGI